MSDLKTDFALWAWRMTTLEDCPQSEVEQLREEIKAVWDEPEQQAYWTQRIRDEANESRLLQGKARGITERVKQRAKESANAASA